VEVKKQYQVKISDIFADLQNLDANVGINVPCESIRENIKTSAEGVTELSL
jgi:hypothetical protein